MKAVVDVCQEQGVVLVSVDVGEGPLRMRFEQAKGLAYKLGEAMLDRKEYGRLTVELTGAGRS